MSAPNYTIVNLDLAVARDTATGVSIDGTLGAAISSVTVQQLPFGAVVGLKLGPTKQFIPLTVQGQTINICPVADEGLFVGNPAAGGILILIIWYADSATALGT